MQFHSQPDYSGSDLSPEQHMINNRKRFMMHIVNGPANYDVSRITYRLLTYARESDTTVQAVAEIPHTISAST